MLGVDKMPEKEEDMKVRGGEYALVYLKKNASKNIGSPELNIDKWTKIIFFSFLRFCSYCT